MLFAAIEASAEERVVDVAAKVAALDEPLMHDA